MIRADCAGFVFETCEVIPLEDKRADTVAEALVFKVLLEHGVPKVLYSKGLSSRTS